MITYGTPTVWYPQYYYPTYYYYPGYYDYCYPTVYSTHIPMPHYDYSSGDLHQLTPHYDYHS